MQQVLKEFYEKQVLAYIDNILIMGSSFQEHLKLVGKVLETLWRYSIKIKPSKCHWFKSVSFPRSPCGGGWTAQISRVYGFSYGVY